MRTGVRTFNSLKRNLLEYFFNNLRNKERNNESIIFLKDLLILQILTIFHSIFTVFKISWKTTTKVFIHILEAKNFKWYIIRSEKHDSVFDIAWIFIEYSSYRNDIIIHNFLKI